MTAETFRSIRDGQNLSREKLGGLLGITGRQIFKFEKGIVPIKDTIAYCMRELQLYGKEHFAERMKEWGK